MAKPTHRIAAASATKKVPQVPVRISYLLLLISYGFVTVITPNLMTLDSNGPKFLALSLLNLATFLFLFTRKELKNRPEWYFSFFKSGMGIAYAGLMIISLLSFFKAINVVESVLHFAKIFTTFSAAYLISILVASDKRYILYLCAAMTVLLVIDSMTVFSGISKYLDGKLPSIGEIKSVYSNKNILASSIFVKIPFALWLMVFRKKWMSALGILGTFFAITATLFMSTRAFYLGTIALTLLIIVFFTIRFIQSHDKYQLRLAGIYLIILVSSFLIFSATQHFLFPKTGDVYVKGVGARLSTISSTEGSTSLRLAGWKRSWNVFKDEPLLGVGLGNWKIATLKEENQTTTDFNHQIKAHNDFVETTTETGIFGGLLFLSLFIMIGWVSIRALNKSPSHEWLASLFLPAFGLLCYSFDAFFNFPQDRPEISALFALYIGMAVHFTSLKFWESTVRSSSNLPGKTVIRLFGNPPIIAFGMMLAASTFILLLNFNSQKLQRIVADDILDGKLNRPASMFLNGFPAIPNLTSVGVPIAVQKARYLINEQRNSEAISMLKKDRSNSYEALPECLIAEAYNNLKNLDSALIYAQKAYDLMPNNFNIVSFLGDFQLQKGMHKESEAILEKYLNKTKTNKDAWLYASSFYDKTGNIQKAATVIDSAARYFPADSLVLKQKAAMSRKAMIMPNQALYDAAFGAYNAKKYDEAAGLYSELLAKVPGFDEARIKRAFCYYYLKEYTKSNLDLDLLISSGPARSNLINLRGVNLINQGNNDEACKYFKTASDLGDKDGITNYSKFCQPVKK